MDGDASIAGTQSTASPVIGRKEMSPYRPSRFRRNLFPSPLAMDRVVRPSRGRRIVQILLALQYVVRRRRMPTYMGGEADKKIEQLPVSGGTGPVPSSRMERKTSGGLIL